MKYSPSFVFEYHDVNASKMMAWKSLRCNLALKKNSNPKQKNEIDFIVALTFKNNL